MKYTIFSQIDSIQAKYNFLMELALKQHCEIRVFTRCARYTKVRTLFVTNDIM